MERVCYELVWRAADRVRFVVISRELAPDLRPLVEWRRIRVPRRPMPLKFSAFFARAGVELARARADLVHTVGALVPNRADFLAIHFCHASWYQTLGALAPPEDAMLRRINTAIQRVLAMAAERWCYRPPRARTLAAVSARLAAEVERHYPGVNTIVTPNGVDTARFRPDLRVRNAVRCSEGLGDSDIVALFVGGDWYRKGLEPAIAGLAEARAAGVKSLRLWVVGGGNRPRFEALAAEAGIREQVRFFGSRTDVPSFYQAADVLVAPSQYEPFSLALVEAAASGLPLVATDAGVASELVGRGDGGVMVTRSPAAIGAALARLATDPQLREAMSVTVRRRADAFSWESSVESVLAEYERLLSGSGNGKGHQ
jgi:glycosyltransferase involved in cell wall biosynthesis